MHFFKGVTMKHNDKILIVPSIGEVKIWFDPNYYRPDKEAVRRALIAGSFADYSSGSLNDIDNGLVVCNYNPVTQEPEDALKGAARIADVIKTST